MEHPIIPPPIIIAFAFFGTNTNISPQKKVSL